MRKRTSVEKAEWTESREDFYKKECYNFAFYHKDELVVENQIVYVLKGTEKITILKPMKKKSFWFETWTELKRHYNI